MWHRSGQNLVQEQYKQGFQEGISYVECNVFSLVGSAHRCTI